jgi:hypothetical protein
MKETLQRIVYRHITARVVAFVRVQNLKKSPKEALQLVWWLFRYFQEGAKGVFFMTNSLII